MKILYTCICIIESLCHTAEINIVNQPYINKIQKNVSDSKESISYCFDYCSFSLKSRSMIPLALLFFIKIALAVQGVQWFCIHFRIIVSNTVKNVTGILVVITLNPQIAFGNVHMLKTSSNPRIGYLSIYLYHFHIPLLMFYSFQSK